MSSITNSCTKKDGIYNLCWRKIQFIIWYVYSLDCDVYSSWIDLAINDPPRISLWLNGEID